MTADIHPDDLKAILIMAAMQIALDLTDQCTSDAQATQVLAEYEVTVPDLEWLAGLLGCKPGQVPGETLREFERLVRQQEGE